MSAATLCGGDRVRSKRPAKWINAKVVGVQGNVVVIDVEGDGEEFCHHATDLEHVTPMSPEARMVWHAMRAGAKRTARIHITSMNGTCYRVRQYTSDSIALRVEVKLPPLAEDEAGR